MLELFHAIADPASARVRKFVTERGLKEQVDFRNVHFESHAEALKAHGGSAPPALWDGERLHQGEEAVIARLEKFAQSG